MLVRFKSAFYDGTTFWPVGVHPFPEHINDRKVVFHEEGKKPAADEFALPRTAEPAEKVDPSPAQKDVPTALSQLGQEKPKGFVEAMSKK